MEGMYAEYSDVYGDMEGVVGGGAGPSNSSADAPKPPKKNVIVDEQHPFDLEAYIASYGGEKTLIFLLILNQCVSRPSCNQATPLYRV
jgi:hypothetical protein